MYHLLGSFKKLSKKPDKDDPALVHPWKGGGNVAWLISAYYGRKGVVEHRKISNFKRQITNKSQIPIINDQNRFGISNLGYCNLFDICDLEFLISYHANTPWIFMVRHLPLRGSLKEA